MSNEIDLVELVRRIIAGDADAEAELVDRYQAGVSILINRTMQNRSLAEDAVQETFRILLEKIRLQNKMRSLEAVKDRL